MIIILYLCVCQFTVIYEFPRGASWIMRGKWGLTVFQAVYISVIFILMSGIAVSSSPAVRGFSIFWLTVFGKRRPFSALWYCSFALSYPLQVDNFFLFLNLELIVNDYTISMMKLVGHPMTVLLDRCTSQFEESRSSHVLSRWLRLIAGTYMLEKNKHARWIQLSVSVTDHKCGIGISSVFDMVFGYFW